ncbi:hypothetical protein U8D42_11665 [Mycobacterium europaeum]|uniref:hypothetical protein n=1 Tax=Mycobacterium europaeum TaxID=761804 RepID=UPI002AE05F9C|nr:hypothetical protein [Mycobacterium europaeum]MEA1162330.1 hypothetical protein [Mycobacterium europaeum]
MDVAGLSHERGSRRGVGLRDRRAHGPHAGVARPDSARPNPAPAPSADRRAGDVDPAVADVADRRQADYFVRLLLQNRRLIDQRIDDYQKAIATAQANGDVDAVGNLRRMERTEEQDRDSVDGMLEKLRRRFARSSPGQPPAPPARPRAAIR